MTANPVSVDVLEPAVALAAPDVLVVPAMIAARAAADPLRPAVVDGDRTLTYADLELRAAVTAAELRGRGVGPGSCVAVLLDRSAEFVATAYGIWRTGAAYLPLDPAAPDDRISYVLADSGAAAVVTHDRRADALPPGPWQVVTLDAARPGPAPTVDPGPDDLAYVIYTSGSTGRPKGVELTHGNLASLVDWHVDAFGVTASDRASQVAGLGFDAAVWEIWPHLAVGAAVHIADETTRRSPQLLRDWLVAQRITVAFVPTVLAEQLVQLDWPADTALRTLLTGADVLHQRPRGGLPFALVNNYGPTECTVVATSGRVDPSRPGVPSIGRPIGRTRALVLDDALRPVAPGEPGELCLAGAHVGRGYRNDPGLTASRFVTVEQAGGPPLRLYRTGDVVRLLDDGELAFLGRRDQQVKIRGYRIEPAEIVVALDLLPEVDAAAVVARASGGGEPELVAYVVTAAHAQPTADALRTFLAARLPDYMIPSWFVGIAALPVTVNGKLDAAALPAPDGGNLLPGQDHALPGRATGALESRVGELVRGLLNVASVDPRANIFLLGGHSMLAMQLVSLIKQVFGVKLALRQVFEHPTVAELAAVVAARTSADRTRTGSS